MKRYPLRIRREVSYVEEVDAVIVAKSQTEAERIAAGLGEGEAPMWPDIDRYSIVERTPERFELLEVNRVAD